MKSNPVNSRGCVEHDAACDEHVCECAGVDSINRVSFKVNSAISEQCNRIFGVHVRLDIVFEVELEGAAARSALALFVHKCETNLNQLQEIYVASDQLKVTVSSDQLIERL